MFFLFSLRAAHSSFLISSKSIHLLRVDAAVKEVPELQAVEDARMGMTEDKMSLRTAF